MPRLSLRLFALIMSLFIGSIAFAQSMEPFTVRIEQVRIDLPAPEITVNVILESGWANMSGLDFLLAYENTPLKLTGATQGPFSVKCDWEYFSWHSGPGGPRDEFSRPTDTVRVIAVASLSPDHIPACYNTESKPLTLFTLTFQVTAGDNWGCAYSPIRFYWRSCYDNRISVPASVTPLPHNEVETIAQRILEPTGWDITNPLASHPGWFGPPESCVSESQSSPVPFINLINGGVTMLGSPCKLDCRGDLNVNGTAYEIEDSWIFAKYLLYGDTVFRHGHLGLESADMNRDRRPGTVEDLVLMMRAVLGEYRPDCITLLDTAAMRKNPFVPPTPQISRAAVTVENNELLIDTKDRLIAARFVFKGRITPHLYNTRLDLYQAYVDGETRLLIYGFFSDATFGAGPFLYWDGDGTLHAAALATADGGRVDVKINR